MDLFSSPGLTVLQVLQDINLPSSFRGILEPAIPETIIGKPVLSGAGLENFIPALGPGEFVLESGHRRCNLLTEPANGSAFVNHSTPLEENIKLSAFSPFFIFMSLGISYRKSTLTSLPQFYTIPRD